jgi:hypothetical protein
MTYIYKNEGHKGCLLAMDNRFKRIELLDVSHDVEFKEKDWDR